MKEIKTHGCFARYDRRVDLYQIGNEYIQLELLISPDKGMGLVSISQPGSDINWIDGENPHLIEIPESDSLLEFEVAAEAIPGGGVVLRVQAIASDRPYLRIYQYEVFPRMALIRFTPSKKLLKGSKPVEILEQPSVSFSLYKEMDIFIHTIKGIRSEECQNKSGIYPSFTHTSKLLSELPDEGLDLHSGTRSSELNFGWMALENQWNNESLFMGIEWSGQWQMGLYPCPDGQLVLQSGLTGFKQTLQPGKSIDFPSVFIGLTDGDVDFASIKTKDYLESRVIPSTPAKLPWVMDNTWFGYGINLDEKLLKDEIDGASQTRCDGIFVGPGWYTGSPMSVAENTNNPSKGLGTWTVNPEKYPSGLKKLSDYTHGKALKFGLWVEPERVDKNTKDLTGVDWTELMCAGNETGILTHTDPDGTQSHSLCLGCPETRKWILEKLSHLIETCNLDWLRWDQNQAAVCTRTDHGHQVGDGNYSHIKGLYEVLDTLRAKYPKLVIENSSSGANRLDFGIIRHLHTAWLHDTNDNPQVCRHNISGASLMFPLRYLNTAIIQKGDLSELKSTQDEEIKNVLRSRMFGVPGLSLCLPELDSDIKSLIRKQIEFYKKYKQYLEFPLFRLTPQPELRLSEQTAPAAWEVYQFLHRSDGRGILFFFRGNHPDEDFTVPMKNLKENGMYELKNPDTGSKYLHNGDELMENGFTFQLPDMNTSGSLIITEK